jgi:hypothetical protein
MKEAKKYNIIIGGGRTGVPVFPAISIANALNEELGEYKLLLQITKKHDRFQKHNKEIQT